MKNKKYAYINLVECYSPNCSLGNWKKPLFPFCISKKQGLSQNELLKIKPNINNNGRVNLPMKSKKPKKT